MKKLFLSLVLAIVSVTMSFAQSMMVATLTHGEEIKMYYGTYAFREAMNDATHGDVISLSGGVFYPVDVTKAVSIKGTGVEDANPTIFNKGFNIKIPASASHRFTMEGIKIPSGTVKVKEETTNPLFMKCIFKNIHVEDNTQHAMFISCEATYITTTSNSTSQFISCYIEATNTYVYSTEFINCVLDFSSYDYPSEIGESSVINCIIVNNTDNDFYSFPNSTVVMNCISVGKGNPFSETYGPKNISGLDKSIFIDSDTKNDLTNEAKAKYLGYDGTPVGMYGGISPRNMTPSYPRITKMNVAKQTTADGKLSVDIEVSTAK